MTDGFVSLLTFVSAIGSGLVAGIFFAFSAFVMKALSRIPPARGISAMQSINVTVINPWFLVPFLGTGLGCIALAVRSFSNWQTPDARYQLAGSMLYLVGTILVTFVFNVPRNDALAAVDPASTDGARLWSVYVTRWTAWNHVRTAAALAAAVSFTLALCRAGARA